MRYTYFTKLGLVAAAIQARRMGFNRRVDLNGLYLTLNKQPDSTIYPVLQHFLHDDTSVRCEIAINEFNSIWLDVEIFVYNHLPTLVAEQPSVDMPTFANAEKQLELPDYPG